MKKKHPEHVNHERWLVSYADFITLLFAFFVVLFASGQTDKRKQIKLAESMQSAFNNYGLFDPHAKTPAISADGGTATDTGTSPIALPLPSMPKPKANDPATQIRAVVTKKVEQQKLAQDAITIHASSEGLVVSLHEAGFFDSGSADIRDDSLDTLKAVAAALPHQDIRVEGHTDDVPIHTAQFATNWELSTARAASITRLLIAQHAAEPTQISAAGYAEFRPIADNATEQGRAKNRRVDIILLAPKNDAVPAKPESP